MDSESPGLQASALESVRYAAGTDIGMRREENQDSFGIVKSENFKLFIVADGMGGVKGGATASSMAISIIDQMVREKKNLSGGDLVEAVSVANRMIFEKGSHDSSLNGMGTTLVALAFIENELIIANVGDSRAYRIRGDRIKRLTEDHTLVMELVRSGTISLEQAGNHPVSHMLTRSLGPTPEVEVDCFESGDKPRAGDRYLLCSDGLYNLVTEGEMFEILNQYSLDDAIEVLIDLANQRGGTDNITTILIELDENYPSAEVAESKPQIPRTTGSPLDGIGSEENVNGAAVASDATSLDETTVTSDTAATEMSEGASAQGAPTDEEDDNIGISFDPFSIPNFEEEPDPVSTAEEPAAEKIIEKPTEKPDEEPTMVRSNPVISERISFGKVAKEAGLDLDEDSANGAPTETINQNSAAIAEGATAHGRFSSKALIILGVLAGFLGGGLAVVLFSPQGAKRNVSIESFSPIPRQVPANNPRIAEITSELPDPSPDTIKRDIQLPSISDLPQVDKETAATNDSQPKDSSVPETSLPQLASILPEDGPSKGTATLDHLKKRAQNLTTKVSELKAKIAMFDRPLTGVYGQLLQNDSTKQEEINGKLAKVQTDVDTATRKLAVWYGRRTRLQESDLTNLATEVAISSSNVKEKKEAFELATWEYLKEAEVLRYLPTDKLQKKKVDELAEVRNRRMHELTDEVHGAIDHEIRDSESQITRLTLEREQLSEEAEALNQNIAFIKTLMSNDNELKKKKRAEFEKELAVTESELKEVEQVIGDLSVQESLQAPAGEADNSSLIEGPLADEIAGGNF